MSLKAILFDLDGTLVDTDPIHRQIFAELLSPYGYVVDETFYRNNIAGSRNEELFKRLLPALTDAEIVNWSENKEAAFRKRADGIAPLAGLGRLMRWAKERGLRTALVTNATRANVRFMLSALDLRRAFDFEVVSGDVENGKPDPAPYLLALERLSVAAEDAVAFEDSVTGIRSATGAGLFTYGVTTTHPPQELIAVGAGLTVPDYEDMVLWQDLRQRFAGTSPAR